MAAKTKLTPEIKNAICKLIELRVPQDTAALASGVSDRTFRDWKQRGARSSKRAPLKIYIELAEAVKQADARAEAQCVAQIVRAAQGGTWTAAAWLLERKYPDRWARQDRVMHQGVEGGPVQVINRIVFVSTDPAGNGRALPTFPALEDRTN